MTTVSLQQAIEIAAQRFGAGRLGDVEQICRQILDKQPTHDGAMHLLGLVAYQQQKFADALHWVDRALLRNPVAAYYHSNRGAVLNEMGRHREAIAACRRALELQPNLPDAMNNLGTALKGSGAAEEAIGVLRRAMELRKDFTQAQINLAGTFLYLERLEEAAAEYKSVLARHPDQFQVLIHLTDALRKLERFDEALAVGDRAVALQPGHAVPYFNRGNILAQQKRFPEAIAAYHRALSLQPNYPETMNNLANCMHSTGQHDAAIQLFQKAIMLKPDYADPVANMGNTLLAMHRLDESIAMFQRALAMQPNHAKTMSNLAAALFERGRYQESVDWSRRSLEIMPDLLEPLNNLGAALKEAGQVDESITHLLAALKLRPDSGAILNSLGNSLKEVGRLGEAIEYYGRAAEIPPPNPVMASNKLYTLHFHPDYDSAGLLEASRNWNRIFAQPLKSEIVPHANDRDPDRKLRVGYVSPDFYAQAESFFVAPLLESHDHKQFEIYCYSSVRVADERTIRLRRSADVWRDVVRASDVELAKIIRDDRIDVLVDLTMHMANHRLLAFARKPAPVQATWLAYPGGTGLDAMDWRLTDAWMDPPGSDAFYAEKSYRLPDSWCCYDPLDKAHPAAPRGEGLIRFGSLNNPCKLNEPVLKLWARLMREIPSAQLLILAGSHEQERRIAATFEAAGVARGRVEFAKRALREEYLRIYDGIDIALDPLPYNGITTTCDALWMGVPVVSLTGKTAAGRAGLSILSAVGLADLAAEDEEKFLHAAVELAQDAERRAELRQTLRDRVQQSPLMDGKRFAGNMETAYRAMWKNWCEESQT